MGSEYDVKGVHMNRRTYARLKLAVYSIAVCSVVTTAATLVAVGYITSIGVKTKATVDRYYTAVADETSDSAMLTPQRINTMADDVFHTVRNVRNVSHHAVPVAEHANHVSGLYNDTEIKGASDYVAASLAEISPTLWGELSRNATKLLDGLAAVDYGSASDILASINQTDVERAVGARADEFLRQANSYRAIADLIIRFGQTAGSDFAALTYSDTKE